MLENSEPTKIVITCRFIQHDQWLTTHIDPSWTIRQLKLWLVHRLFQISIPPRIFMSTQNAGKAAERPPSPITFAPDPRMRPASPIVFAPPKQQKRQGSKGWLSDTTDEDRLTDGADEGDESSGPPSYGGGAKGKGTQVRVASRSSFIPGGRIGPRPPSSSSQHNGSLVVITESSSAPPARGSTIISPVMNAPVPDDRYPGGVNHHHWSLMRYSTGQILTDDESLVSWYDINEYELLELHGLSFPSTHPLYEYQVYHLWNPDRHRERERLRKKLKKRFEAETKEGGGGKSAAQQAQILKAMNLNSGAGANVGVVEYYGEKLATKVELTLTRIPRAIDTYVQPYWEGWVRTLRIVWKGDWSDVAATGISDPYRYGVYGSGNPDGAFGIGVNIYHNTALGEGPREKTPQQQRPERIVRVEWRERWVRIQNGTLAVLRDRENEEATHVLPLKDILSLTNTQHLIRYLSYTGFNPPLDHPAVTPEILMPALNLPIPPPPQPAAAQDDDDSDPDQPAHHSSQHGHSSSLGGSKEYNFTFPNISHLYRHIKARELTPLVGSRFDPTYLPVTIEEQRASGLRIVCLQFRKNTSMPVHSSGGDDEKEGGIDPITLALEDMRERASDWGGIRSNNSLWWCLPRLKGDPPYISRAKMRMRMRSGRGISRGHRASGSSSTRNNRTGSGGGGEGSGGRVVSERSSTIRGLRDQDWGYPPPQQRHAKRSRVAQHSKRSMASITSVASTPSRKERIYELERESQPPVYKPKSQDKELDIHGILAAQIFGGQIPSSMRSHKEVVEERERREKKERQKREKELEKERMKHEKEREKGKGKEKDKGAGEAGKDKEKDRDWGLGSLNVAFWNWGKKKKAKRQREWDSSQSKTASASTLQLDLRDSASRPHKASGSISTAISSEILDIASTSTTAPTGGSSITVVVPAPVTSSDDEDGRAGSGTSVIDDTTDDEGGEEEQELEALEPYPHEHPPDENDEYNDDENDEEIEYADLPSTSRHHDSPPPHAVLTEEELDSHLDKSEHHKSTSDGNGSRGAGIPSVVVQVAVDKRVEHEEDITDNKPGAVVLGGQKLIPERETLAPLKEPVVTKPKSHVRVQTHVKTQIEEPGHSRLTKKPSERLIGQLHSSDEEREEGDGVAEEDDADLSSPVFAPPPLQHKVVRPVKSASTFGFGGSGGAKSLSSHSSVASVEYEEDDEGDFDEDLDDDLFGQRRAGYRYGTYDTRREEERRKRAGYEKELEEQREREIRIREQREWEAKQKEREREEKQKEKEKEKEKERERKERKKKEEEGEWVCLDLGNDFAFQSFLRIIHQHCPHPMKSSFMERMIGGPLDDAPPPPQKLPQPLVPHPYSESTSNSVGPSSPNAHLYHSHFQPEPPPRPDTSTSISSTLESKDAPTRVSVPNSPTSPRSQHTASSHASFRTPHPRHALSQSPPSLPSVPSASPPSSQFTPPSPSASSSGETSSDAEYIAPLPGYGDPRFTYPSRTHATPPYPEWRLNILRKAQCAGMGDVGRAMEMIHWGKEDPVISEASGTVNELERLGKRWGNTGGFGIGKWRETGEGGEDNVSSLGTIGPRTVGSGGTIKGVPLGSPSTNRKRLSLGGTSARNSSIPENPREGGESGNESSAEDSDGSIGGLSIGSSPAGGSKKAKRKARVSLDLQNRLTKWSDDSDEEHASELEWLAWQIDIRRQAKRQYAIQARREANATGTSTELDLGLPVHPADDMKRFLENRQKLEPSASITLPRIPLEDVSSSSVSVSHSLSGGTPIVATSSSSTRIVSDKLSPHHARTPSQQHHILHHSASLHTGLRKGAQDQPARRPSMPILYPREEREKELREKEKERDKGKGKEWSFWPQFGGTSGGGGGYPNEDLRSPTSSWFSSKRDGREMLSPGGSGSQPPSAGGSVGRSGSMLLKGHLLGKKGSGDIMREKERGREREHDREREQGGMNEENELKKTQRPQLRVATTSSAGAIPSEAPKFPEQVKSPTFVPKSFVRRMRSDASILSLRAGDTSQEGPSSPHQQGQQARKKKGAMDRFMSSTFDFVDGK